MPSRTSYAFSPTPITRRNISSGRCWNWRARWGQLGLELISGVIDVLLDMVTALIEQLKSAMNAELKIPFLSAFYEGLTDGRKMTLASISALILSRRP